MDNAKQQKLIRFANDRLMNEAVYDVLMKAFTARKPDADVHVLAASYIAIDQLKKAWVDIVGAKSTSEEQEAKSNPGV